MKKAVIVSLTMLFLCVSVTGLWANNLFLPLITKDLGELTGRWEGSLTSGSTTGCNLGTAGLLLRQSGDIVTGTIVGFQISYGNFVNGVFTGTALLSDQSWDLSFTLSADKQTLNGRMIKQKPGRADQTWPITFIRLSNDPTNPDLTPPAVEQITLSKSPPYVISVRWSKPIVGWNIQLKTYIGGIFSTISGTNLVDCPQGNYNPQTYTYTMQMYPTILPDLGASSTLSLCSGEVNWGDAYGIPAWPDCSQATPLNFKWPKLTTVSFAGVINKVTGNPPFLIGQTMSGYFAYDPSVPAISRDSQGAKFDIPVFSFSIGPYTWKLKNGYTTRVDIFNAGSYDQFLLTPGPLEGPLDPGAGLAMTLNDPTKSIFSGMNFPPDPTVLINKPIYLGFGWNTNPVVEVEGPGNITGVIVP